MTTQVLEVKHFDDLGFSVALVDCFKNSDGSPIAIHLNGYEIVATSEKPDERFYDSAEDLNKMVTGVEKAKIAISMRIKWDGCSDLSINNQHNCSLQDINDTLETVKECWKWALDLLPDLKENQ